MENENDGVVDTLNQQEEEVLETPKDNVDTSELEAELKKAKELANNYKIRAEKAERLAREKGETQTITNNSLSRDEAILIAKGYDEEALENLNKIAKATNKNIKEAQEDPLFIAWQEKREAEKKSEKARLGASKGSGYGEDKLDFSKPGLSREEHKKLWQKTMSK